MAIEQSNIGHLGKGAGGMSSPSLCLFFTQVAGGNGAGSTPERLNNPWGIYVDVNGSLFVADRNNHRIQLWETGRPAFGYYQLDTR